MNLNSDQSSLAYAKFDLWMSQQLEQLVARWISLAAPQDARMASAWRLDRDEWNHFDQRPREKE